MVRAANDLGRAHEVLGGVKGACEAYERALLRWGQAPPRSRTADLARAARSRLHCDG